MRAVKVSHTGPRGSGKQSRLTRLASPEGITVGPDGTVWATDSVVAAVFRIDPEKGRWTPGAWPCCGQS